MYEILIVSGIGPPGQVAAVAGPKDGMKQGELGGALKELGYSSEQVCACLSCFNLTCIAKLIVNRSLSSSYRIQIPHSNLREIYINVTPLPASTQHRVTH